MRKLWIAGALAAALMALTARADDAAKERREAADATKAEMKQDAREARAEASEKTAEVKKDAQEKTAEVKKDASEKTQEARAEAKEKTSEAKEEGREVRTSADKKMDENRTAQAGQEKKHPLFDGKKNFDVDGKIQKVSKDSITLAREELPAVTLRISKDTKVELDGEQVSANQLKQGQDVKASFNLRGDKPEAVEIKAEKMEKSDSSEPYKTR